MTAILFNISFKLFQLNIESQLLSGEPFFCVQPHLHMEGG